VNLQAIAEVYLLDGTMIHGNVKFHSEPLVGDTFDLDTRTMLFEAGSMGTYRIVRRHFNADGWLELFVEKAEGD
jgi:hypothetical protein